MSPLQAGVGYHLTNATGDNKVFSAWFLGLKANWKLKLRTKNFLCRRWALSSSPSVGLATCCHHSITALLKWQICSLNNPEWAFVLFSLYHSKQNAASLKIFVVCFFCTASNLAALWTIHTHLVWQSKTEHSFSKAVLQGENIVVYHR